MFQGIVSGEADAAVFDAPVMAYYEANEGRGKISLVGPVFKPEQFGIALQPGSPYREDINRVLLKLAEEGTVQALHDEWFGSLEQRQ